MEGTFHHIKIGDTLYKPELSIGYERIYRVVVEDIRIEEFLTDWKTVVKGHVFHDTDHETIDCGTNEYFSSDIICMSPTLENAKNRIAAEKKKHPMLGRNQNEDNN